MECGKLHVYFSEVQRLVTLVSYLHLFPGIGFHGEVYVLQIYDNDSKDFAAHYQAENNNKRSKRKWRVIHAVQKIFT
jgi:hypothetical protein